ncbi:EF-hand [Dendrothele bispora CBS 962.96]|uniref:EF-hand n=1 Tax=Dendrothele bispora (strain CBS 962.96) TaxID=1314807 RepID=A0A4S8LMU0_DENBC|nr:EF-hand [Dendrothele bispora CBS 962.96]
MPTTHQITIMLPPTEPQYSNVSATHCAPRSPGGEYGGYDGAPPPYSYGQQSPPDAPGSSAAGHSMEPPDADPQLLDWFAAVDTDSSGRITVQDLEIALMEGDWTPFNIETVKMLMSIFDTDRSGTIDFNEFASLWKYIEDLQDVFRNFDHNHSGSIDGSELGEALSQVGFRLPHHLLDLVQRKYGTTTGGHNQTAPTISFEYFIRACVAIWQLSEAFQQLDSSRDGWNYDHFMYTLLTLLRAEA